MSEQEVVERRMTEQEATVIAAAMWLCQCWEGSKYGPMQRQIKKAEAALVDACADLASENEGTWRNPHE